MGGTKHLYPYIINQRNNGISQKRRTLYYFTRERNNKREKSNTFQVPSIRFELEQTDRMFHFHSRVWKHSQHHPQSSKAMICQAKQHNQPALLPEQLQLEFHYSTWMHDLPWTLRTREAGELALFFGMLFREAGYLSVHVEQMENISSIREVLLLRVFC